MEHDSNFNYPHLFVTAIGTDSGKTVASAILCQALKADYWKPVQCGAPTDTNTVRSLIPESNSFTRFFEETYLLETPASPHIAAEIEQHEIFIPVIKAEYNSLNPLQPTIIEGAGGLMVPLNENDCIIDIPRLLEIPVVLVANLYLGSINHTLLSCMALKQQNIEVAGIIFNGEDPQNTKPIILEKSGYRELLHIHQESEITPDLIEKYAKAFRKNIQSNRD